MRKKTGHALKGSWKEEEKNSFSESISQLEYDLVLYLVFSIYNSVNTVYKPHCHPSVFIFLFKSPGWGFRGATCKLHLSFPAPIIARKTPLCPLSP